MAARRAGGLHSFAVVQAGQRIALRQMAQLAQQPHQHHHPTPRPCTSSASSRITSAEAMFSGTVVPATRWPAGRHHAGRAQAPPAGHAGRICGASTGSALRSPELGAQRACTPAGSCAAVTQPMASAWAGVSSRRALRRRQQRCDRMPPRRRPASASAPPGRVARRAGAGNCISPRRSASSERHAQQVAQRLSVTRFGPAAAHQQRGPSEPIANSAERLHRRPCAARRIQRGRAPDSQPTATPPSSSNRGGAGLRGRRFPASSGHRRRRSQLETSDDGKQPTDPDILRAGVNSARRHWLCSCPRSRNRGEPAMLINFFFTLRAAKLQGLGQGVPDPARGDQGRRHRRRRDGPDDRQLLLPGAHRAGQGRGAVRQVRPRLRRLLQGRRAARPTSPRTSRSSGCRRSSSSSSRAEEKAAIEKMGWDELMETLKKRFEEQKERHEGGNKMIGTGGTSPVRRLRLQPAGHPHRPGQGPQQDRRSRSGTSASTRTTTTSLELGTRNIKVALRRLRRFAREGSEEELDLDDTIRSHRRQRRLARHQDGARAAQQGEGAAADGRRRHDGRAHPPRRGAVLAPPRASSSTSSSITSTTASTTSCGRTTGAATARSSRPGTSSASTTRTTS